MKVIKANELVKMVAGKLGLDFETDNFGDFYDFVKEVYSQFTQRWECLEDQACYWHEANVPERILKVPTEALKAVYADAKQRFQWEEGDTEFYDEEEEEFEPHDTPFDIQGPVTTINYVDAACTTAAEFFNYWMDVCKRFGCKVEVIFGSDDDRSPYCNHDLQWTLSANGIESKNAFFEIPDDSGVELMDALYWLCENFYNESFAEFNKFGVELRYFEKENVEG